MNKVQIEERLIHRIGVREWGLPTARIPGQIWRSERDSTITCMLEHSGEGESVRIRIETLPLEVIPMGELSIMPDEWRAALWEYVKAWPYSGSGLGPFLKITEGERNAMIRKLALGLDNDIGCRSIAGAIGKFAAVDFDTVEP